MSLLRYAANRVDLKQVSARTPSIPSSNAANLENPKGANLADLNCEASLVDSNTEVSLGGLIIEASPADLSIEVTLVGQHCEVSPVDSSIEANPVGL